MVENLEGIRFSQNTRKYANFESLPLCAKYTKKELLSLSYSRILSQEKAQQSILFSNSFTASLPPPP
jgi:hypothetical protein